MSANVIDSVASILTLTSNTLINIRNVMRVRVRPRGLASFGLRVSSDCDDATSIGTWGSPLLLPISVFYATPSQV